MRQHKYTNKMTKGSKDLSKILISQQLGKKDIQDLDMVIKRPLVNSSLFLLHHLKLLKKLNPKRLRKILFK